MNKKVKRVTDSNVNDVYQFYVNHERDVEKVLQQTVYKSDHNNHKDHDENSQTKQNAQAVSSSKIQESRSLLSLSNKKHSLPGEKNGLQGMNSSLSTLTPFIGTRHSSIAEIRMKRSIEKYQIQSQNRPEFIEFNLPKSKRTHEAKKLISKRIDFESSNLDFLKNHLISAVKSKRINTDPGVPIQRKVSLYSTFHQNMYRAVTEGSETTQGPGSVYMPDAIKTRSFMVKTASKYETEPTFQGIDVHQKAPTASVCSETNISQHRLSSAVGQLSQREKLSKAMRAEESSVPLAKETWNKKPYLAISGFSSSHKNKIGGFKNVNNLSSGKKNISSGAGIDF